LFNLTQNDAKWCWGELEKSTFEAIQSHVVSTPTLMLLDNTRPFRLEVDNSNFATGVVLSQQSPVDNKWHLIAYYSKSLSVVEHNYKIHDKEILAVNPITLVNYTPASATRPKC
jgi:hypothetical protein